MPTPVATDGKRVKSVLYVLPYLEAGGTERHVLHLVRSFHDEARVALLAPSGSLRKQFLPWVVTHRSFPRLERDLLRSVRLFRRQMRQLILDERPDVIHVHAAPELALLIRTVERLTPIVLTLHGFAVSNPAANYKLAALLARLGRVGRVIVVSQAEAEMLYKGVLPRRRISVIYNGIPDVQTSAIDWRAAVGWPAAAPILGAVGRLEDVKGFDLLLRAFARLKDPRGDTAIGTSEDRQPRLVIVGEGSREESLKQLATDLGVADRVYWAGYKDDAARAPTGFDISVMPSRQEALPLACLEAMAAGCPVVASDVGGLPEAVGDGETGYVVPSENVDRLTEAIQTLLDDPELAQSMGAQGRQKFLQRFHVDSMINETWAVYEDAFRTTS